MSYRVSRSFYQNILFRKLSNSSKKSGKGPGKYSKTVFLPKTTFQIWLNAEKRIFSDSNIMETTGFSDLYSWQRENLKGEEYILHDGPPYANGFPHMGHAVNKILKDIVIRNKVLQGRKVHYVPGWDCHGLPIELKATAGSKVSKLSPIEIRQRARHFASRTINDQRNIFKSWGIMADWNSCYHTFDKEYVKNEIRQFWNLYEKGLVYRDLKPVHWSPSSRTALAEAELEYKEDHHSDAVTLRLKVTKSNFPKASGDIYLLIWTTTPWTLPGNVAVAVNPDITYALVLDGNDYYVIAKDLIESVSLKICRPLNIVGEVQGTDLLGSRYLNIMGEECPVVSGTHVTSTSGTGLVHTAPAHGHEDFLLAVQHNLPLKCIVNEAGKFNEEAGDLRGLPALDNKAVLAKIEQNIFHKEDFIHSYPYDWRTNKPVIMRASQQWFIDTEKLKNRALEVLDGVEMIPTGMDSLRNKIESRPYWCISRQRVWGVPIPVLYDTEDQTVISRELIDRFCSLVEDHGTDFWWTLPESDISGSNDLKIGKDILDIWFDSGLTWNHVLGDKTADLFVEGRDQVTGWFQSSLLTSIALKDKAPYKKILVHGFAVDENGRKMSKSLGNVTDPQDLIAGTGGGRGKPYGIDIVRWWVGEHSLGSKRANITVSQSTLTDSSDSIYKIRSISRFILGSLNNFTVPKETPKLFLIDNYILHRALDLSEQCDDFYETFQFNKVCSSVKHFISNELSSAYCHLIKDRLYCDKQYEERRIAAQFSLYHLMGILNRIIAPIVPILAEEINAHMGNPKPLFYQQGQLLERECLAARMKLEPVIEQAYAVKASLAKSIPINSSSIELAVEVRAIEPIYRILKLLHKENESYSQLTELLQVSTVDLIQDDSVSGFETKVRISDLHLCERCRRHSSAVENVLCSRCSSVIFKSAMRN